MTEFSLPQAQHLIYGLPAPELVEATINDQTLTLHQSVAAPLVKLCDALAHAGLGIKIVSHWRSFDHQCRIWREKWEGQRPLLDRASNRLETQSLNSESKFAAMCFWSALPGLSRHHWGTDFDIFLAAPIAAGHTVELTQQEFAQQGVCAELNRWLEAHLEEYGFFRPYQQAQGGVSPEPWHISYFPVAEPLRKKIEATEVASLLTQSELPEKQFLLGRLENYINKFVNNIAQPKNTAVKL
ncbi:MAG: M15 family metallopeptidase [Gammaproteobacteria bacterium]|nr:M15 family metallopeptidase [Gammaproteobacteria bacterium]NVK87348.1 M15 family metallopeptidase [Gammaproteobacteria bacterium]